MDRFKFSKLAKTCQSRIISGEYCQEDEAVAYAHKQIQDLQNINMGLVSEVNAITQRYTQTLNNAVEIACPNCDKHTGKNAPTWDEFTETIKDRCHMCDFERIQELESTHS